MTLIKWIYSDFSICDHLVLFLCHLCSERAADAYALKTAGNRQAFINAMRKLASVNLADSEPHPLIEFFFHSHPSIEKRIQAAERWRG